ncbi:methyl-accepting chemotaxis protein [Paenibacillus sp. MER 99-2]|uniref:methyl-accepting chemotaxis protein n=1 Tax=Paenibacillus sp. MER 99-2 TaxID=2939572 RepID=UPI00203F0893|nr:methyl-accepting chemotaxis protein [Paenibacillus sp. MER 99-2]MCM3173937.1 methyl-accepting chemotaxis protein [Paenibacillus sp. MER 99-2]
MNSLFMRIFLFFSCLMLAAGAVLGVTMYRSSAELVEQSMGMQAQAVAERAAQSIDVTQYAPLSTGQNETAYYGTLREQLSQLREANGLKYLYTLGKREENGTATYYYVVDGAAADVSEDDFSPYGSVEETQYEGMLHAFANNESVHGELTQDEYGATITAYVPIHGTNGEVLGIVGADLDSTAVYELMTRNRMTMIWTALVIVLLSVLLVYGFAHYLTRPLVRLKKIIAQVGKGDLTVDVELGRKDEVGQLATEFKHLVTDTRNVMAGIRKSSDSLLKAAEGVSVHSRATAEASQRIAKHTDHTAQGATEQVARAGEVTMAMEEITRSMQHIAHSASLVAGVSQETTLNAVQGQANINTAIDRMDKIHQANTQMSVSTLQLEQYSSKIESVALLMKGIASQTSLLALNASIEAARAGEHGNGFAVVASEVRKLATESEQSSLHVSELIAEITRQTQVLSEHMSASTTEVQSGLVVVQEAGRSFTSIHSGIDTINERLHEVSAASEQLSASAEEISASVENMEHISRESSSSIQEVSAATGGQLQSMGEISASAESLRVLSSELNGLIARFKI